MRLTSEIKKQMFVEHGGAQQNTGSAEAQIAMFTHRIQHLTEHLKTNKKDYSAEKSLIALVGKRRALLNYIAKKDIFRYRDIIQKLGLRK
ncbi:MAG: 30S ribosomal protein S15 [Flavobacteriales bacterium]|nr:30S ribosomal protein S15 [Bacteroidota bacterium]MCB9241551.1 30S ribosomal protein S15 [Flavobacteriales bacterium]